MRCKQSITCSVVLLACFVWASYAVSRRQSVPCRLVDNHIYPYPAARHATAYYTALEMSLIRKDKGSQDLQKVLEGEAAAESSHNFTPCTAPNSCIKRPCEVPQQSTSQLCWFSAQ